MPQQQEFRRQARFQPARASLDEGIDAAGIRFECLPAVGRQCCKRSLTVAEEVERLDKDVGQVGAIAEQLRQAPLGGAARQLHLPQPVLRVHEAERAIKIVSRFSEDMRDALAVAHDFHGRR